jgi:succinate-semialdehyde dehydrogenase/glutarate-semialdehyde dehydrogenase
MGCQSVNFYDGKILRTFEDLTDGQLESALVTAADCSIGWRSKTFAQRAAIFVRASAILVERLDEFATTVSVEMGALLEHSRAEIKLCADVLSYYAKSAQHLLAARYLAPRGGVAESEWRSAPGGDAGQGLGPLGIVFGVEPWNFPYYQLTRFAAPNLMAGNVVMVKHAQQVPQCAADFAELWLQAGAPAGAFTNVLISAEQVNRVIEDPRIQGVALTGPVDAGNRALKRVDHLRRQSAQAARQNPEIVTEGAQFDETVQSAVWGELPGYYGPRLS